MTGFSFSGNKTGQAKCVSKMRQHTIRIDDFNPNNPLSKTRERNLYNSKPGTSDKTYRGFVI